MNTENITINCLGASNTQILIDNDGVKTKEKVLFKEEWDRYLKNIDTKFLKIPKAKEE
jgi:hypothetical protein